MKAVIPAAGKGTRSYPIGIDTPKALLKILNKPIIEWTLETLEANGIHEAIIVISADALGDQIRQYLDNRQGIKTHITIQPEQMGNSHAIQTAKDFFQEGEEFIFLNGDDLYGPGNIKQLVETEGLATVGIKTDTPERYGILSQDENGNLIDIVEKPQEFIGDIASVNCTKLHTDIFKIYEQTEPTSRGEYEITDGITIMVKTRPMKVLESTDYWVPVGYPWQILEATEKLMHQVTPNIEGEVEEGVTIKGKLVLPPSSKIKAGSYIEGDVVIGGNTVIGPNAYIRGNTVIGNDCKIGFGVEIKNSVVGDNSKVPHLSYLPDSILGDNVNFAGGSIAANFRHDNQNVKTLIKDQLMDTGRQKFGTVIGNNVKLGVNTMIYPGRKIWPGCTTLPGETVKDDIKC